VDKRKREKEEGMRKEGRERFQKSSLKLRSIALKLNLLKLMKFLSGKRYAYIMDLFTFSMR